MNGFNVKLKNFNGNVYINFKAYGNVLSCINIYIYIKLYMYACVKALWKFKNV